MEFHLPRPWSIRIPPLVRYLEREYVEEFFQTGRLQLTTYKKCQEHECEVRRDAREGKSRFNLTLNRVGMSGGGLQTVGWQSYMLCTSMTESKSVADHFKVNSYFKIVDAIRFLDAISRWIPGCSSGRIGPCIYRDEESLERPTRAKELPPQWSNTGPDGVPMSPVSFEMSDEPYFIKSDEFSMEAEFRFVWGVPYEIDRPLIIECPEAIQFCEPDYPVPDTYKKPHNSGDHRATFVMAGESDMDLPDETQQDTPSDAAKRRP